MKPEKSCPFCGGTGLYQDSVMIDEDEFYFWVCRTCGCEGPSSLLPQTALLLWDIRDGGSTPLTGRLGP